MRGQVAKAAVQSGELYSLAKGFGPYFLGVFREREGSIFSNHQHFAVSTGICGVAPLRGSISPCHDSVQT